MPFSRKDLPYVNAVLKETLRFHPILPMSLPYKALEDYPYRGMLAQSILLFTLDFYISQTGLYLR